MSYRVNGRATPIEERLLRKRDKNSVVADAATVARQYNELKSLFDEYGWSALDKTQKELFDDLRAVFGTAPIDIKFNSAANELASFNETMQRDFLDDRGDDNEPAPNDGYRTELAAPLRIWIGERTKTPVVLGPLVAGGPAPKDWVPPATESWLLNGHRYRQYSEEVLDYHVWSVKREVSYNYGPFLPGAEPDDFKSLARQRILNEWRDNYPEKDFPDNRKDGTGMIPSKWMPPRKDKPTRHSALATELQSLLHCYESERSNEPIQTNFYIGDNDNFAQPEEGDVAVEQGIECGLDNRPTENELMNTIKVAYLERTAFPGVVFEDRPVPIMPRLANPNNFIGPRLARRVPCRGSDGGDVEWDNNGNLQRMAHLRFGTLNHERTKPDSEFLGEIIRYRSAKTGRWHSANDKAGKLRGSNPKPVIQLNTLFDNQLGAKPSNSNVIKWKSVERRERESNAVARWEKLYENRHGKPYDRENEEGRIFDLQMMKLDMLPVLPPAIMPLKKAREFCGLLPKPANDNTISFGLPYGVISAAHLSMAASPLQPNKKAGLASKVQTADALHGHSAEAVLLRNEDRETIGRARAILAANDNATIDAFFSAENFAQVGQETGDRDKHGRTQERNGQERLILAAATLSVNLNQNAA